ncbi:hypothetical protein BDD14_2761 [Edaphobacter modestus]|uniref:Uncharacterized protein n=1 Tax=Edaphobacter modestus TaxID=388466 RepID=A0A4Q7YV87_9BACT|nr:hypothetical protein BDD14_2761 [Edaphobacter modestus]
MNSRDDGFANSENFLPGRRAFIGGLAGATAGFATSLACPAQEAPVSKRLRPVTASDSSTVAETSAGKVRGFEHKGI